MTGARAGTARGALMAGVLLLGACRVDELELEGRRCPCVDGWVCETATDTCVRELPVDAPTTDDGDPDGPGGDASDGAVDSAIDAIDAPLGSSCLGGAAGASLFSDDFADLIGWVTRGGSWSATGGEAVQGDGGAVRAYALPAGTETFADYRVGVRARRTGGSGTLAIALRIQATGDGRYLCAWAPTTGALTTQWIRTNGSPGGTLSSAQVDIGTIPGYDPAAAVVLEAQAVGGQLTCCVRDLAGAFTTVVDTRYATGAPGLGTDALAAGFDDLAINAP